MEQPSSNSGGEQTKTLVILEDASNLIGLTVGLNRNGSFSTLTTQQLKPYFRGQAVMGWPCDKNEV